MAGVTEVRCPEAEVDGHSTAVATLVLQEVRAMLRTHLWGGGRGEGEEREGRFEGPITAGVRVPRALRLYMYSVILSLSTLLRFAM